VFGKIESSFDLRLFYHERHYLLFFFFFEFPTHVQTKVPGNLKSGSVRIYIFIHAAGNFVFVLAGPRSRRQEFL
jgi:hypothetical protein